MTDALIPIERQGEGIRLSGFLGKPSCNRSNRNYEFYFLNGRYIKSSLVAKALEEGYRSYLMQHKYPFCVLMMDVDPVRVDVNVHPAKMEVRFTEEMRVYEFLLESVREVLAAHEMIPEIALTEPEKEIKKEKAIEPFQKNRTEVRTESIKNILPADTVTENNPKVSSKDFFVDFDEMEEKGTKTGASSGGLPEKRVQEVNSLSMKKTASEELFAGKVQDEEEIYVTEPVNREENGICAVKSLSPAFEGPAISDTKQLNLFEERIISETGRQKFQILGQAFDTYWIVVHEDRLLMIDQHAAHEKVKYERIMKAVKESDVVSQYLYPPLVLSLSGREQEILSRYREAFEKLGFELEYFDGNEINIRSAPAELFGSTIKDMFLEVLDELSVTGVGRAKSTEERIATMACKAAVKGNMRMSVPEMEALLDELLTLDNPYFCPHGRPTIISFTRQELEKKFKRIV